MRLIGLLVLGLVGCGTLTEPPKVLEREVNPCADFTLIPVRTITFDLSNSRTDTVMYYKLIRGKDTLFLTDEEAALGERDPAKACRTATDKVNQ